MPEVHEFSHGAQWVRADFHLHTNADQEFTCDQTDQDYRESYVQALLNADISVGAITNHNKFDLEEYAQLRGLAGKSGVTLLPGVELSIKDGRHGVHALVICSDEWLAGGENYIQAFLNHAFAGKTATEYEDENASCQLNLSAALEELEKFKKDYFVIFAHVESKSGLWNEVGGARLQSFKDESLFGGRVLGFQKVRTHDGAGRDVPCRTKVKDWLGDAYPAEVEGCDAKAISEIGKGRKCYIKIGEGSFSSVKFALRDHHQRVAKELPEAAEGPRLSQIKFIGGRLKDQIFPFSNELTSLIGSRGSGKSAVIECLRYGLTLEPGEADYKYKNGLVSAMLGNGGEISITGQTADGSLFEIRRAVGLDPTVSIDGLETKIAPMDILPGLLYFGQKDLGNRQDGFEDELFAKLVARKSSEERAKEDALILQLRAAVETWKSCLTAKAKEKEYTQEAELLKHQLKTYKDKGVEKQLVKLTTFDIDKRNLNEFIENLESFEGYMQADPEEWDSVIDNWPQFKSEALSELNVEFSKKEKKFLELQGEYGQLLEKLSSLEGRVRAGLIVLEEAEKSLQDDFSKLQREIDAPGLNLQEYRSLKLRYEKLGKLLKAAGNREGMAREALVKVKSLATSLDDLRRQWHRDEYAALQESSTSLPDSLVLEITYQGNRAAFEEFLKRVMKGTGFRSVSYEKILETFPNGLALLQRVEELEDLLGGTADVKKLKTALKENLADFLSFHVPDLRAIRFNGSLIQDLSLGQRATALLQLLMSLHQHPILLIDQPEDDLDNETIFREVVGPLLTRKKGSQFIIATHNPNIPVLGDAELVHACRETDREHYEHDQGSLDTKAMRKAIVSIMEGGAEAFAQRQKIYIQWTNSPSEKNS